MKDKLGVGIVGAGAIGQRGALMHLGLPDAQEKVHLAAVCDPVPGRAEAAADKYGVSAHYLSYEELLADPRVDLVTICTPIGLHYEQGVQAIEAGKHIHFNKTMTITTAEADDLIARAKRKGIRMVASPGMMLFPHNQRIRRLVMEGALGRLTWAIAGASGVGNYHMGEEFRTGKDVLTDVKPGWYFQKPGGGPQYDVTVYCLHNLTGILGPVKRVTAMSGMIVPEHDYHGQKIQSTMDDNTILLLDLGGSAFAAIYASPSGQITQGFQPNLYGDKGSIIGNRFGERDLEKPDDLQPHVRGEHVHKPESHVYEDMMQLVDFVREGTTSIASPEHARHVIEIIEAGYRAAETGQTQNLHTSFEPLPLDALAS